MDYVDYYHRPYPRVNMGAYQGQSSGLPQGPQLAMWTNQQLMALYQQQRHAVLMAQGNLHMAKQTEPKPRLTKEEVDFLEGEFAKNPKPTSSTKREIAEQMRVEVPRINNWFQNRRAKEKQLRKHREMESTNRSPIKDEDLEDDDSSDNQGSGPSTAPFGEEADEDQDCEGIDELDDNDKMEHTMDATADIVRASTESHMDGSPKQEYPSPQPTAFNYMVTSAPMSTSISTAGLEALTTQPELMNSTNMYSAFPNVDYFNLPQQLPYGQESLDGTSPLQAHSPDGSELDHMSPSSFPGSPYAAVHPAFKTEAQTSELASRRNTRGPAPLVGLGSLRTGHGPKTGVDAPRRPEGPAPMRRISSASGFAPSRIQKNVTSGPKSPFGIERNKDALFQTLHTSRSPVLNTLTSAFSPISAEAQPFREHTLSPGASDEEQAYSYGSLGAPFYTSEPTIKSPPTTPGLRLNLSENMFSNPASSDPWNYMPQDESLTTPSLCSHGSEVEFAVGAPLPSYVASQPVTPSYPSAVGPAYNNFYGQSLPNTEYTFPDAYSREPSARSSPGQPAKAKTQFQFAQNITPQDFNSDK